MFDIGWTELLLIGIVALIVVGPNDLPGMFRTLGRFTGKARRMAREFQTAMNEAADQTGIKETAADLKNMTSPKKMGLDKLNEAAERFDKWEPGAEAKPKGPETQKLSEKRAEAAAKIHAASAAKAKARMDAEMAERGAAPDADAAAPETKPEPAQSKDAS